MGTVPDTASWKAFVKAMTSGNRLAGCFESARITTDSSAGLNLSRSFAELRGIGGSVSS